MCFSTAQSKFGGCTEPLLLVYELFSYLIKREKQPWAVIEVRRVAAGTVLSFPSVNFG